MTTQLVRELVDAKRLGRKLDLPSNIENITMATQGNASTLTFGNSFFEGLGSTSITTGPGLPLVAM